MESVFNFVENSLMANKGVLGGKIRYEREVEFPKGRTNSRTEAYTRYFDETTGKWSVTEVFTRCNVRFALDYQKIVEYNMPKEILDEVKEYPLDPTYAHKFLGNVVYQNNKDENVFYIRGFETTKSYTEKGSHVYLVNGRPATDDEVKFIEENRTRKTESKEPSKKLQEYGVEKKPLLKMFKVDGVKYIEIKSEKFYL